MKKLNSFTDAEHLALVAQRIKESGMDLTADYGKWIEVAMACASVGEEGREPFHDICSNYPGYKREKCDEKFDNCLRSGMGLVTLGTLMQLAKEAGVDVSLPRGRRHKSEEKKEKEAVANFERAKELLCEWAQWRFNVWSNRLEICEEESGEWRPVRDRDFSTYYSRLKEAGVRIGAKDVEHLILSRDFATDMNPFFDYLDALREWHEGDTDYIREFFVGHMEFTDPEHTDFYDLMFRKWFVGMVALWKGLVDENPTVPTFCGEQHIGKTYFVKHILPPVLQPYLFPVNPAAKVDKDFEISMSETPIMFLDEFSMNSLQKSEAYKYAATSSKSYLRDSYAHFREMRSRKASLIAATNQEHFIREQEGSRRFLAVNLKATVNLNEHPLPYEGAYAQALWLLEHGFDCKPNQDESRQISEHNADHVIMDDATEALRTFVRQPTDDMPGEAMTAGDLMRELSAHGFHVKSFSSVAIGKAMKALGFTPRKINGYNKYVVVLADIDRMKQERRLEALDMKHAEQQSDQKKDEDETLPF